MGLLTFFFHTKRCLAVLHVCVLINNKNACSLLMKAYSSAVPSHIGFKWSVTSVIEEPATM